MLADRPIHIPTGKQHTPELASHDMTALEGGQTVTGRLAQTVPQENTQDRLNERIAEKTWAVGQIEA